MANKISKEIPEILYYIDETLRRISNNFYYNVQTYNNRFIHLIVHNHELEERFPLLFPDDSCSYIATLANLDSLGYSLNQSFIMGSYQDDEGENWKKDVKIAGIENVSRLMKRLGSILIPCVDLKVIDSRFGDIKIKTLANRNKYES